jgi:hypothetical protein
MRKAVVAAGSALVLIGGVVAGVSPVGAGVAELAGSVVQPFDFDGDGFVDLAVGVRGEDLRGRRDAGAVQVLYGSASGVTARDQLWHQGRRGVKGALEKGDRFGSALASGDFDADGYADLAIGVPDENVGRIRDAGIVQVLYGSARGLTARDQVWHQGKPGVPGSNEEGDGFGGALAAGDFNADGYADLAVGSPIEDGQNGRVVVLRGGPRGLTASGALSLRQGRGGIPSQPAGGERFGSGLAVGDVNGDGRDDLAIVVAAEADIPSDEGIHGSAVHLLFGGPTGLTSTGSQYILTTDLLSDGLRYVRFSATFGDFNRDGRADLVLASADGPLMVLHGHEDGLHIALLSHTPNPGQDGDWGYGSGEDETAIRAAAGDFTGDGYPDLVFEGGYETVKVILGSSAGLVPDVTSWSVPAAEYADLAVLRLSGGSHAWVAATREPEASNDAGAVTVVRGTPAGTPGPATVWSQDSPGIKGASEPYDVFGNVIGG